MSASTPAVPPGPKNLGLLREVPHVRRGVLGYLASVTQRYPGPLVLVQLGPGATYIPNEPAVVREMLVRIPDRFARRRWWGELLHLVGEGLLTSDEKDWVGQRRRLNPAYATSHRDVVDDATADVTAALADEGRRAPGPVDAQADVKRALLTALVRIMFTPDVRFDARAVIRDLDVVLQYVSFRSQVVRHNLAFVGLKGWGEARLRAALARLDALVYDIVDGCRDGRYRPGLLLAQLVPAWERGEIDRRAVHDEIGTLVLAGFDTTSAAVTFALGHLADRPDVARAVAAERGRDETPTTDAVVQETIRLQPPVWAIHRTATENIDLGGYTVPRGEHVMACPYAMHRNPRFWTDPDTFAPERFAPDADRGAARDALVGFEYLPFSHGRHTCIGKRMAMQQCRLMLTALADQFDVSRDGRPPALQPGVILQAKGGLRLRPVPRA